MLVANSFDLWQKDTFFSAAEEVQQSADIMESAYRTWLRARREGLMPQHLDELGRELQMALGTAKWQLEEFERAVRLSYRSHGDDITISRHKQFVSAIDEQISHVESALRESFEAEGKKPFRWVNLDEEECDDLALFLSGTSGTPQRITDEKNNTKEDSNLGSEVSSKIQMPNKEKRLEEVVTSNEDAICFIEREESRFPETGDEISYQAERIASNRRTWSSPDESALEIVIDKDDREKNDLIEATPKEKVSKPFFWNPRGEDRPGAKGGVLSHSQFKMTGWINQRLRGGHRSQRQQLSPVSPVNSMRFILALMLTIFLVGTFFLW
ncbi:hypothetical protein DH2020_029285 [Rehmannia glutinosa]|uniref:Syntaxin 6/10/61 N-terminal domain-containing protein n=1 Tax=Rehmannia glutinosa TaxID=99300 RepID=A0ABR0VPX1_REHGL